MGILGGGFGFSGATRPDVRLSVFRGDIGFDFSLRFVRDTGRVGTHVGDQTLVTTRAHLDTFIEVLGQAHGFLRFEVEPERGFLLHCTGGIGWVWLAALFFLLYL